MATLKRILQEKPVFLLTLPLFFVLHGCLEHFPAVQTGDFLYLAGIYIAAALVLTFLFRLFFKDTGKAALFTFALLAFNFFFGSLYDFLLTLPRSAVYIRYIFILPFFAGLFVWLFIWLKRTASVSARLLFFLNLLFLVLSVVDTGSLILKNSQPAPYLADRKLQLVPCDSCAKPDIYLIIADEYAGSKTLNDLCQFDNTRFLDQLRTRGFHIVSNSRSNYNATAYSMASMFTMQYLPYLDDTLVSHKNIFLSRTDINRNNLTAFLQKQGYSFSNFSFFDFAGVQKSIVNPFFVKSRRLITAQTFLSRIAKNTGHNFASSAKIEKIKKTHLYNNRTIEQEAKADIRRPHTQPRFMYIHLAMPHHPYYFDSSGKEAPYTLLTEDFKYDTKAYVQYLVYTNKKLIELVDHIRSSSAVPPVILVMGEYAMVSGKPGNPAEYSFINLNAVYLPDGNYKGFYDGMTNVNQFRVLLNSLFRQPLPPLKDSLSYILEK